MYTLRLRNEIAPELVAIERRDGGAQQCDRLENAVEGFVCGLFVGSESAAPEAFAVQADVPVGEVVADEGLDEAAGQGDVVVFVGGAHVAYEAVLQRDDPSVDLGQSLRDGQRAGPCPTRGARYLHCPSARLPAVDVGIKREERVGVVESAEELAADLVNTGLVETQVVPRLGIRKHIPAESVGAVLVEFLERIHGIAEALAHLVAVLVEHKSVGDDALESGSSAYHRMYRVQGIEPAARLVDTFGDEVGGAAEIRAVDAAKASLGIRHRTGIEPYVDKVALAGHLPARRAHEEDVVDVGPVEIDAVVVILAHVCRIESLVFKGIGGHYACCNRFLDLLVELLGAAYADFFLAVFGTPDRERRAPETAAAEVPVLDVLEPNAEASGAGGFRLPADLLVQGYHLVFDGGGADEPGIKRIIYYRAVGTPAVRIAVNMLLHAEQASVLLHHHAKVHVEHGSILGEGLLTVKLAEIIVYRILYVAAGELLVGRIHRRGDVCRIEVFQTHETPLSVHLRHGVSVDVDGHHAGDSGGRSHPLVVGAECRGDMHYAGTVLGRHIVAGDDAEGVSVGFEPGNQLLVAYADEFRALE